VKRIRPLSNPDYQQFYEYIDRHELHLQRCSACGLVRFPISPVCYACFSGDWEWLRSSGRGRVSSWVVFRRQYFEDFPAPYTVVQVEMHEGPRLTANLLGADPEAVRPGMPVKVVYEELEGGRYLMQFEPAEAA
jgi:uncharacterized protein